MSKDELQKIKWAGWMIVGTVGFAMSGWFCSRVIANGKMIAVIEERQNSHYTQLREDIADNKTLLRRLDSKQPSTGGD